MPTIILREIECYRPREIHDEPYFRVYADSHEGRTVWGPARMGRGDVISLTDVVDPIVFHDFVHVALREEDRVGADDHYGTLPLRAGRSTGDLEHYFPGDLNARYRLSYRLLAEPTESPEGRIELRSLVCNDPQGTKDEITLKVNDVIVAGPTRRMRAGWSIHFDDMPIDFQHACVIELKDTQGQDWDESTTLVRGEYELGDDDHDFIASGRGIVGDASYTLYYRMVS